MKKNIKIAFITSQNPEDKNSWSGTLYNMYYALKKEFEVVDNFGPARILALKWLPIINRITIFFFKKKYNHNHSFIKSYILSKHFERKLNKKKYDLIFAPVASSEIAYLKTKIPILYLSDSTFGQLKDYYDVFTNLFEFSVKESNITENRALKNAELVVFSSSWAAEFAVNNYHINREKTFIIPFGPNIDKQYINPNKERRIKSGEQLELLFVGVNWDRKGGNLVYETFLKLLDKGINARLTVCGCIPPYKHPNMNVYPFLDKNTDDDAKKLAELFYSAHFLFIPTKADCTPIVFSESASFGLPVITNQTGGVGEIVKDGYNGLCLPINSNPEDFKLKILELLENEELYLSFVKNSIKAHEELLNWDSWGASIEKIISNHLNDRSKT